MERVRDRQSRAASRAAMIVEQCGGRKETARQCVLESVEEIEASRRRNEEERDELSITRNEPQVTPRLQQPALMIAANAILHQPVVLFENQHAIKVA